MPAVSHENQRILDQLKDEFDALPEYKKWFYSSAMSLALAQYNKGQPSVEQALTVCNAFLNHTWFFQRWLYAFSNSSLANAFSLIQTAGLLTGEDGQANFNAMIGHQDPWKMAGALRRLHTADYLAEKEKEASLNEYSRSSKIEWPTYSDSAARNTYNERLSRIIPRPVDLLAGEDGRAYRNALVECQDPWIMVGSLMELHTAGLLAGGDGLANRDALVEHQDPWIAAHALVELHKAGLFIGVNGRANRNAVLRYKYPIFLAKELSKLHEFGLLAEENASAVVEHQNPWYVTQVLLKLHEFGLLAGENAQANFDAVLGHQNAEGLFRALHKLRTEGLLIGENAQVNFDGLITHFAILCGDVARIIWDRIPSHLWTTDRFRQMIAIATLHRETPALGQAALVDYVTQEILGMETPHVRARLIFNPDQSTHTASIHETASASATRLKTRYGAQISGYGYGLNKTIKTLSTWLNAQPDDSIKIMAAKRCLQRLATPYWLDYSFTDPISKVSTKEILALLWIAIHDEELRTCDEVDGKAALIEGLYEAQRGYNLSDDGEDNKAPEDRPICPAGTFNKIIEKGCGLHPDIEMHFISYAGTSSKFPIVVNEEAMVYLQSFAGAPKINALVAAVKEEANRNTVEPIWETIRSVVANRMFEEFKSLYGNNASPQLLELLDTGIDVPLTPFNLRILEQIVAQKPPIEGVAAAAYSNGFFTLKGGHEERNEYQLGVVLDPGNGGHRHLSGRMYTH